jgi:hypothetical protein
MMKNAFPVFMLFGFLVISCTEKEEIETFYGEYIPQSISAEEAIDITGDGVASMNLLEQLYDMGDFPGRNSGRIFLNLYSPQYFNVHFSQVLMRLPYHYMFNDEVLIEYYQNGRRFDLNDNRDVVLDWNTFPPQFESPNQFFDGIEVDQLIINQGKNSPVQLVLNQRWYDFSKEDWIETKVYYTFSKR